MKIAGKYVGLGPGDDSQEVANIKAFLKKKFTWVRESGLDDSTLYTGTLDDPTGIGTMASVVKELQDRYGMEPAIPGVMDYATKVKCSYLNQEPVKPPVLITAQGTGVDMWTGYPADVARALGDKVYHQPLGNWPASAFPMWSSITQGVAEGEIQCRRWAGDEGRDIYLAGYSQGAVVTSLLWKYSFNNGGVLQDLRHKVKKSVTFGNPMRELGRAHSDGVGEVARQDCSGIMEDLLVDTPSWWRDYAHKDDLYTDCELNDEGEFKRAICKIIMGNQWWAGDDSIFHQIAEILQSPLNEVIAMFSAIWDAGMFFGRGTEPHVNYNIGPAVDYLAA